MPANQTVISFGRTDTVSYTYWRVCWQHCTSLRTRACLNENTCGGGEMSVKSAFRILSRAQVKPELFLPQHFPNFPGPPKMSRKPNLTTLKNRVQLEYYGG